MHRAVKNDSRVATPHRLGKAAAEFYWAARLVALAEDRNGQLVGVPAPVMYLIGHSMELALKAFLVDQGWSANDLKKRLGHDLRKCLSEAKKLGILNLVHLSESEEREFELLDSLYSNKQLEYVLLGPSRLPNFARLEPLCERLALGLWKAVSRDHGLDPLPMRLMRYKRTKSRRESMG